MFPIADRAAGLGLPAQPWLVAPERAAFLSKPLYLPGGARGGPGPAPSRLSCPASPAVRQKSIDVDFQGGEITTNGGTQLVHMAAQRLQLIRRLQACFQDGRDPHLVVHDLPTLLRQRLYGLVLGHEDLIDHDELRKDKALQASLGRLEPRRGDCEPLAGKSTLNRLELAAAGTDAAKARKIGVDFERLDRLLLELYLERHPQPPRKIVLDIDATDVPLYGEQEERFYHGYYQQYCYMPLLFLVGRQPLLVRLRTAAHEAAAGLEKDLAWLLERLRAVWPRTRIIVRTDSAFCREEIMALCEGRERVDYVLGLSRNPRLQAEVGEEMQAARRFKDFEYQTQESWSRPRRVVGKAEALPEQGARGQGQPALRGDVAAGEVLPGAHSVRELLLCAGQRGEPGEGAQGASVLEALLVQSVRRQHAALPPLDVRAAAVPHTAAGAAGHAAEAGAAAAGAAGSAAGRGARARADAAGGGVALVLVPAAGGLCHGLGPAAAGLELRRQERDAGGAAGSRPEAAAAGAVRLLGISVGPGRSARSRRASRRRGGGVGAEPYSLH